MRKLGLDDAFALSEIVDKMEIDLDIEEFTNSAKKKVAPIQKKIDLAKGRLANAEKGESAAIEKELADLSNEYNSELTSAVGGKVVLLLFKRIYKAKDELLSWVGTFDNKTIEEVRQMSFGELKKLVTDIFSQEGLIDLFQSAGGTESQ